MPSRPFIVLIYFTATFVELRA